MQHTLHCIELHNTTLKALRSNLDVQKLENHADSGLENPELEFNALWGSPAVAGYRRDFKAVQAFDLATLSGNKRKVAKSKDQQAEWEYLANRREILLAARQLLLDLTYCRARLQTMDKRIQLLQAVCEHERRKLATGNGTQLEVNKALRTLTTAQAEREEVRTEQDRLQAGLTGMNGGEILHYSSAQFPAHVSLPEDFERWWPQVEVHHPIMGGARNATEVARRELSLARTQNWPSLSVGYMREKTCGERLSGITLGMSIPLWNSKRRIKQAQAAVTAAAWAQEDVRLTLRTQVQALYQQVKGLHQTAIAYRKAMSNSDNDLLLKRALQNGEISFSEYADEMNECLDAQDRATEADYNYHKALAELQSYQDSRY